MKLENHRLLDALCGEYIVGTLRGAARRRFEQIVRDEPRSALRLRYWERTFAPTFSRMIEVQPSPRVWQRLERQLGLDRYRMRWHQRVGFWKGWAGAVSAALVIVLGVLLATRTPEAPQVVQIAQLSGKDPTARVTAHLSRDGRTLVLRASRPVLAGPNQSYELWLIPAEQGAPIPVAVLGSLDATFAVPPAQVGRLLPGATLAVSTEPAGGSPTGQPTGTVILAGQIAS
jgi:anti-sigma-K factor RskA